MEVSRDRARGIQRGQRSVYQKTRYTGVTHETVSYGIMHERTEQVNPLVPVGQYTIIEELIVYDNPVPIIAGHMPADSVLVCEGKKTRTLYKPARDCCDTFGKPFFFRVKEYTKGIENALDPYNEVVLEGVYASGMVFEKKLRTLYLASGSRRMFKVNPEEVKQYES